MKKFKNKYKKRKFNFFIFLALIILLSVGYAFYTEQLVMNGTVIGSAHFRVYFTEAWVEENSKGNATINTLEGSNRVTFSATLDYPGDKCLVGVKIKNDSSIPAKLNDFRPIGLNSNPDIKFYYEDLNTETEILQPDQICDYEFVIEWDSDSSNPDVGIVNIEIELDYEQYTDNPDYRPTHDHGDGEIYSVNFDPNGGQVSRNAKTVILGSAYGELPRPERTEYTFLGWYTSIENGTMITQNDIYEQYGDSTLYALWSWDGHNYGDYEVVAEATCTEEGTELSVCSICGDEITRSVSALGHDFSETEESNTYLKTTASCTQNGVYYYKCSRCGESSKDNTNTTFTTAKLAHSYTSQTQTSTYLKTAASCTQNGVYYYKCANCTASSKNDTNTTYTTSKTAHSYTSKTKTNTYLKTSATCQRNAVYYYKCANCTASSKNDTNTTYNGDKAGHSYTASCNGCSGNGYTWKSANANWYYCYKGNHCIAVNSCSTHSASGLSGGYTAIKVCSKCGNLPTLYRAYSAKGTGKQCTWCGTGYKK